MHQSTKAFKDILYSFLQAPAYPFNRVYEEPEEEDVAEERFEDDYNDNNDIINSRIIDDQDEDNLGWPQAKRNNLDLTRGRGQIPLSILDNLDTLRYL